MPRRGCAARSGPGGPWSAIRARSRTRRPHTGITEALRDAELLARAAARGIPAASDGYESARTALTVPLLEAAERVADYAWDTAGVRELLLAKSAAMKAEVEFLCGLDLPALGSAA